MQKRKSQDDDDIELATLLESLREEIEKKAGGSQKGWVEMKDLERIREAVKHGIRPRRKLTATHVSRVLNEREYPNDALLQAMGYQLVKRYRKVKRT